MWSAIVVPIFFAVVGWIVFNFFAKPLVDFLSLRSQVHEEIIFTGNIGPMVAGTADRGLIGLSNSLALTDDSRAHQMNSIQAALKLPPAD
jgi:hypothetical protein